MAPMLLAQTTTTTTTPTSIEVGDASRPLSDFLIDLFDLDPDGWWARALELLVEPVVQIVVILLVTWVGLRFLRFLVHRLIDRAKTQGVTDALSGMGFGDDPVPPVSTRRRQRLDALSALLDSILGAVVWIAALFIILNVTFGISLAPLLAGAGIVGLALGFGAQDLVKDFISGLFMLAEDQFGVGDVIDVGEATGVVERVSLRTTRLRDVTGTVWHVPNGEIRRVGNMSQEWSRALLDIGVAYGADIDQAAAVIKDVAHQMAGEETYQTLFLAEPEVWGVESLADSTILIRLVIKTQPGEQWAISRELRRRIKLALDEASIEIPFPQRTIWVRHDGDEAEAPPPFTAPAATGKGNRAEGDGEDHAAGEGPDEPAS